MKQGIESKKQMSFRVIYEMGTISQTIELIKQNRAEIWNAGRQSLRECYYCYFDYLSATTTMCLTMSVMLGSISLLSWDFLISITLPLQPCNHWCPLFSFIFSSMQYIQSQTIVLSCQASTSSTDPLRNSPLRKFPPKNPMTLIFSREKDLCMIDCLDP